MDEHSSESRDAGSSSEPRASSRTSSRIRKASVRAALFQKPELIRIGRFILLECIGAGAMGEVYTAYDEQLDRKVALKLVRSDLRSQARADKRLLREAQTLAQVSHPNVVQVYDAGVHEGDVFLAMELVRGTPLSAWLERAGKLPRRQRQREILRQFIAAGRGLEAAHAAGLAHRDFKPDNVLVGEDGRVRVVDFGLARAVTEDAAAPEARESSTAPEPGAASEARESGTAPEPGAAPEPCDPLSETIGTDVPTRRLGPVGPTENAALQGAGTAGGVPVVTSEMTVDMSKDKSMDMAPEDDEPTASKPPPAQRGTRATDPMATGQRKAALRLTTTGMVMGTPRYMAPEQIRGQAADHRSDQFGFCVALFHALYGEWPFQGEGFVDLARAVTGGEITMPRRQAEVPAPVRKALLRGLSCDPADRFPDMGALLRVLEAWPQRRQRRIMAFAAAAVVATGAVVFSVVDTRPAPCASVTAEIDALWSPTRRAALAGVFAGSGLAYADTVWSNTAGLLEDYVVTWRREAQNACAATYVHHRQSPELLDKRMLCLDRGTQRLGALVASLESGAADAVERAVDTAAALPDPAVCSNTEVVMGLQPPAQPEVRRAVAQVRERLAEARTQELLGRYDDARRIAEEQLRAADDLSYPPVRAEALHQLGRVLTARGNYSQAESAYAEAADIAEEEHHYPLANEIWHDLVILADHAHSDMSVGYIWSGREQAAVQHTGHRAWDRAEALHALGWLYLRDSKYPQAADAQRQAIALLERTPGGSQPVRLAAYYHALANAENQSGDYGAASTHFERALRLLVEQLGDAHPRVARLQRNYAKLLLLLEDFEQARDLLERALETWLATQDTAHPQIGKIYTELVDIAVYMGAFDEALAHAQRARAIYEQAYPEGHRYRAEPYVYLGFTEHRRRNFAAAREAYEQALAIRLRHLGEGHLYVGWTRIYLAESLVELGQHAAALAQCDEAQKVLDAQKSVSDSVRAALLSVRGRALLGRGSAAQAARVLEQAVARFRAIEGRSLQRAIAIWSLARALHAGDRDERQRIRALAEEALALFTAFGEGAAFEREAVADWLDSLGGQ